MRIWRQEHIDPAALTAIEANSMSGHLGIEIVEVGDDFLSARMPVDKRTQQPFGRLHGGASVALAETLASIAANLTVDRREHLAVGMEINANHLRPAKGGFVYAEARPEALGKSTQVWTIRIRDENGALVCISRMTAAVIRIDRM